MLPPETAQALCLVVDRALAFDRDRRYPDARTMQTDVRALLHGAAPPLQRKCGLAAMTGPFDLRQCSGIAQSGSR